MRTLLIATASLLAACGADSVSFEDYAAAARDAYCGRLATCGEVGSVETCDKSNLGRTFDVSASQRAAVEMGVIAFDGEHAAACFDALGSRSCDPTSESNRGMPDACLQMFHGTRHADAACARSDECISGSCDVPACGMACCTGVCVGDTPPARGKLGDPCAAASCEDTLFCDDGTATCVALKSLGGFCASLSECSFGFCVSLDECKVGLYCDASGECATPLPMLDQPCTAGCRDEGTQCSAITRTCVKVALEGQACDMSSDCSLLYRCDATKHCSAGLALGAACGGSERCADDRAFCDIPFGEITGTCALPKADGGPCLSNPNCQSQHCDMASRACTQAPVCI